MSAPSSSGGGCCCGPRCRRWRSARAIGRPSSRSWRATRLRGGQRSMNCSARWRPTLGRRLAAGAWRCATASIPTRRIASLPSCPAPSSIRRPRCPASTTSTSTRWHAGSITCCADRPGEPTAPPAVSGSRWRSAGAAPSSPSWLLIHGSGSDCRRRSRRSSVRRPSHGPPSPCAPMACLLSHARLPSCTRGSRSRMTSAVAA